MFVSFHEEQIDNNIEITNYYADITISNDGDMHVHEVWDMNYQYGYNVRFRDIEYQKFPRNFPFPYSEDNEATFDKDTYSMVMLMSLMKQVLVIHFYMIMMNLETGLLVQNLHLKAVNLFL